MKHRTALSVVAANLVLLLLLTFLWPQHMVAPGPLMQSHRSLETDCFACHTPFLGSRPERCIQCHRPDRIGLATTKGVPIANEHKLTPFHQDLVEKDCVACHSDHKGVQAFHPIGRFSHDLLQAGIGARCGGCHRGPGDSLHRRISGNCSQCHTQRSWTPATFEHDRLFLLDRDHLTACTTCHSDDDYSRYTCYGCHEHSRSGIREEHLEEGIVQYENCVECHRSGDAESGEREGLELRRIQGRSADFLGDRGNGEHQDEEGEKDDD